VLERAFDNTGVGADKVGATINRLQKFITTAGDESSKQAEVMARLGISMQDLQGKTPTEQMQIFANKIAGIQDPTVRAATAMEIFGKSGGQLLPMLNNFSSEIDGAKGQLGSLPGIMDRSAAAFDTISDNFEAIKNKSLEFAAGLIEKLTPALETFTNMLVGADAAGWGAKIGETIIKIADLLIGAFKSPQTAIDAIGLALKAGALDFANTLVNAFINAANFIKEFFASDLPKLLIGQLGNSLIKGFADGIKFFVDNIGQVIINFKEFFGRAIESIATFFSNTFNKIVNFFATDFKNAMENPVDFIRGKLGSALSAATKDGSFTFKDAYDSASGSVIDRMSKGLGAVSDEYGQKLKDGTGRIDEEWKKITGNIEVSAQDFFGAEGASQRVKDKLGELEKTGQNFREQLTGATGGAKSDTAGIKGDLETGAGAMTKAAEKVKETLTMSQQIGQDIDKARKDDEIDKGGREREKINNAIDRRDFDEAERRNERLARKEQDQQLKDPDGDGKNKDRRSVVDMAKEEGIDTFRKNKDQLREEIMKKREEEKNKEGADKGKKRNEEMKPGKEGEQKEKEGKSSALQKISQAVDAIKTAVISLEKKLPQTALGT
jgi:hypothetical protein